MGEWRRARRRGARLVRSLDLAGRCLREGGPWADPDEAEQRAFEDRYLARVHRTTTAAATLFRERVRPLLGEAAGRRDPAEVERVLAALRGGQGGLAALAEDLAGAGPYHADHVEEARRAAHAYVAAAARLAAVAEHGLRAGAGWTEPEQAALREQAREVSERERKWGELVE